MRRIQLCRRGDRPAQVDRWIPPCRRNSLAPEGTRHERRHLPGEIHRPAPPAQPHHPGQQGQKLARLPGSLTGRRRSQVRSSRRWPIGASIWRARSRTTPRSREHIRDNVAGTFHPVGTCRMGGAGDRDAVVDNAGCVRGVGGLRVVDASIMPTAPRGNTNIPTIMVAEKISAAILDAG